MNQQRTLTLERLETRLALSAEAPLTLGTEPDGRSGDQGGLAALLKQIDILTSQRQEDLSSDRNASAPISGEKFLGSDAAVRLRVEIHDLDGRSVESAVTGGQYAAKVFVRDVRDFADSSAKAGGVFQAIIDLDFGDNARPAGPPIFSDGFPVLRQYGTLVGNALRGIGAVSDYAVGGGQAEQFLMAVPFVVEDPARPTLLNVAPSTSSTESMLLFGLNAPIPSSGIGTGSATLQPIPVEPSPPPQESPPPVDLSPVNPPDGHSGIDSGESLSPDPAITELASTLISFKPAGPIDLGRAADAAWFRLEMDDEDEDDEDLLELPMPQSVDPPTSGDDTTTSDAADSDQEEREADTEETGSTGLFFDERLFIEGAFVEPLLSPFRLQFQRYRETDSRETKAGPAADDPPMPERDPATWVDIAVILRPRAHGAKTGEAYVDVTGNQTRDRPDSADDVGREFAINFEIDPPRLPVVDRNLMQGSGEMAPLSRNTESDAKVD
ncbi:hypothetical protein Mal15_52640 [Stieleria maiorica]|uniref:Uncharacterized protein n=1 Tax=Stieleria maiorica TaxID=2795974 RepID=A0A5B9MQD6_9BACT|nr:hypothetical protein [Stieleria maiorica]QEG01188.1 hypothetical protein Mal15_52640 [Stieleria maiorica]